MNAGASVSRTSEFCDILNINYKLEKTISLNTPLIIVKIVLQQLISIDFQQLALP